MGKTFDAKKRIGEHYSDEGDKAPYSLKLMSKNRNKIEDKVKCVFFELKKDFCDIGTSMKSEEILIPSIEEKLHESLIPYIGTKRK